MSTPRIGDHVLYEMNNGTVRTAVVTTRWHTLPSLTVFLTPGADFLVYPGVNRNVMKWDSALMENFPSNLILGSQAIATVEYAPHGFSPGQWHEDTQDSP